jgi:hypothetical protein
MEWHWPQESVSELAPFVVELWYSPLWAGAIQGNDARIKQNKRIVNG